MEYTKFVLGICSLLMVPCYDRVPAAEHREVPSSAPAEMINEDTVPTLEKRILADVKSNGPGERLAIKEFSPTDGGCSSCSATIIVGVERVTMKFEFPGDRCLISRRPPPGLPAGFGFTGFAAYSKDRPDGAVAAPREHLRYLLFGDHGWLEHGGMTMGGPDSIHRYQGIAEIEGYQFVGEGGKLERLTFGLVKGYGYVYLRGKGKVIFKDGKEVKLGY